MNTIEHEGQTYEVLSLDRISEITHAKLAGGKVKEVSLRGSQQRWVIWDWVKGYGGVYIEDFEDLGIQSLRLVPREPVTFESTFAKDKDGKFYPVYSLDDGIAYQGYDQKRFRCVEIVEEEAILKAKGVS
jgi:hypothetical protein